MIPEGENSGATAAEQKWDMDHDVISYKGLSHTCDT